MGAVKNAAIGIADLKDGLLKRGFVYDDENSTPGFEEQYQLADVGIEITTWGAAGDCVWLYRVNGGGTIDTSTDTAWPTADFETATVMAKVDEMLRKGAVV